MGKTLSELNPSVRSEGRFDAFVEVVDTGKPLQLEVPMTRVGHPLRWMRITAVKVEDGLGIAYSDITEQRSLEEQLFEAQKMEAVGRLAGGVAHDFNNLLTVISGTADLLLMDAPADPDIADGLQEIRHAASRASHLTSQLLAYSRRQMVQPRVVDPNGVIREMEGMLRRLLGDGFGLVTRLDPGVGSVRVDPGYLSQVLVNLVVNARDAMLPEGGEVVVTTSEEELGAGDARSGPERVPGRYVVLSVTDSGVGIPSEIRSRIFEPFFTTKPRGAGTGLGLSTVYGIVRQSDGHVEVESEEGEGSTFRVLIPRVDPVPQPSVPEEDLLPTGAETVLIVEDDTPVRTLVGGILKRFGYHTLLAGGAEEGLLVSRSHPGPIDLLLTDIIMPGLNGRELALHLSAERPEMKVLFMSGYTGGVLAPEGLREEEIHFIGKPFTPERVARRVRAVLDGTLV